MELDLLLFAQIVGWLSRRAVTCQRAEDHRLEPDMDTGTLGQWRKHFGLIQGLQETLSISVNYINLIGMIWIKGYIMLYSMP